MFADELPDDEAAQLPLRNSAKPRDNRTHTIIVILAGAIALTIIITMGTYS